MSLDATVALIPLIAAKTFLKITVNDEDAILESLINNMSGVIKQYCGRKFILEIFTEYYDGSGTNFLVLSNYPIISLDNLYMDTQRLWGTDSVINIADDVQVEKASGIIRLWNNQSVFLCGKANVKVVYHAGYDAVPYDIQHACTLMVQHSYRRQYLDQRTGLVSETIGDRNVTYANEDIPKPAKTILDRYRRQGISTYAY